MTKSLGPFDFGDADQRPTAIDGQRKRTLTSLAFDLFFPLVIVAAIYLVAHNFFGF